MIYSKYGRIETVDHIRKKKYTQEFKNNLDEICKPTIKKCVKKPYTKVEFLPDYERFGMQDGLTDDMYNLFKYLLVISLMAYASFGFSKTLTFKSFTLRSNILTCI